MEHRNDDDRDRVRGGTWDEGGGRTQTGLEVGGGGWSIEEPMWGGEEFRKIWFDDR